MAERRDGEHVERPTSDRGRKTRNVEPPDEARQGRVVLKTPGQRRIFFGSMIVALIVGLAIAFTIW